MTGGFVEGGVGGYGGSGGLHGLFGSGGAAGAGGPGGQGGTGTDRNGPTGQPGSPGTQGFNGENGLDGTRGYDGWAAQDIGVYDGRLTLQVRTGTTQYLGYGFYRVYGEFADSTIYDLNIYVNSYSGGLDVQTVPEPTTLTALGIGALLIRRRRGKGSRGGN